MTPAEAAFWSRVNRKAASLSPDLARRILAAFKAIADSLTDAELIRFIESGQADRILDEALLDRAFQPVRSELVKETEGAVRYFARDLPKAGRIDGTLAISFDVLNPRVLDAIRQLDSKVVTTLKDDARQVVREAVERGLSEGKNPTAIAREIRSTVGMSPAQAKAVANYRAELESGKRGLQRQLRDRRFDKAALTPERIDRMVNSYEKRMTAYHAETVSRTATLDSLKLGQKLSVEDAVAKGIYDPSRLVKRWVTVGDDRVRDEHVAMNGEVVPWDQPYSNGEEIPGSGTFNCRCLSRFYQKAA